MTLESGRQAGWLYRPRIAVCLFLSRTAKHDEIRRFYKKKIIMWNNTLGVLKIGTVGDKKIFIFIQFKSVKDNNKKSCLTELYQNYFFYLFLNCSVKRVDLMASFNILGEWEVQDRSSPQSWERSIIILVVYLTCIHTIFITDLNQVNTLTQIYLRVNSLFRLLQSLYIK